MKKQLFKYRWLTFAFFLLSFPFWGNIQHLDSTKCIEVSVSNQQEVIPSQKIAKELLTVKSIFNSDLRKDKADIPETEIEEVEVQKNSALHADNDYSVYLSDQFTFNHVASIPNEVNNRIYQDFLASIPSLHILNCVYRI